MLILVAGLALALAACNNTPKEAAPPDKASNAPGTPVAATPPTPSAVAPAPPAAVTVPVPAEPMPLADKAGEVPALEAKLVADKAYVAVWTAGHEEARLALFTAIGDILAAGSIHTVVQRVVTEAGLMDAIGNLNGVLARTGRFPADFTSRVDAYLAANKTAPRLGLWNPFEKGKPVVDATALAMWMHPNDVPYVRERMLALVRGPFPFTGEAPERRRWIQNAAEVAERVAALGAFTRDDCILLGHEWHETAAGASCEPRHKRPALPPLEKGVVLTVEISFGADRKATVSGDTNLPDGIEIGATFTEPGDFGTTEHGETAVSAGHYTVSGIGPEAGLPEGRWLVDVSVPAAFTQADAVRAVIGEKGEKLTGKLVVKLDDVAGRIVRVRSSADIGGAEGVARGAARRAAEKQRLLDIAEQFAPLVTGALALADGSLADPCTARMRRELAVLQPLRTQLGSLAFPGAVALRIAGASALDCIECSPQRTARCRKARQDLEEAVKKIQAGKTS